MVRLDGPVLQQVSPRGLNTGRTTETAMMYANAVIVELL